MKNPGAKRVSYHGVSRLGRLKKKLFRRWRKVSTCSQTVWLLGVIFLCSRAFADEGQDYLEPSKTQVVKNFGAGSTFMHYVYFAEVIIALISFVKVKNPLLLTGVIVLLIAAPILMKAALGT